MPLLLRLLVAVLAVLALLTARHLHRHQRAAPVGLVAPPHDAPATGKHRAANALKTTRRVARPASAASTTSLLFLRLP